MAVDEFQRDGVEFAERGGAQIAYGAVGHAVGAQRRQPLEQHRRGDQPEQNHDIRKNAAEVDVALAHDAVDGVAHDDRREQRRNDLHDGKDERQRQIRQIGTEKEQAGRSCLSFLRTGAWFTSALQGIEFRIRRAVGQKGLVRAESHRPALVQHEDLIGALDGADALRHDDFGARHAAYRRSEARFGGKVQRARRVVKHEDLRLFDDRARDGQPLLLPARKVASLGLHDAVESFPGLEHEIGLRSDKRLAHLVFVRVRLGEAQIVGDRAGKQMRRLGDDGDFVLQLRRGVVLYRRAVYPDFAFGVVITRDEVDERRLAAAGAADDAQRLPGVQRKGNVFERIAHVGAVLEADVIEHQRGRAGHRYGALPLPEGGRDGEHLVDARGRRRRFGERHHEVGDDHERQKNLVEIVDERDDLALRQIPVVHRLAAQPDDERDGQIDDGVGKRVQQSRDAPHADIDAREIVRRLVEVGFLLPPLWRML